jgi:hypothetical protein
LTRESIVKTLTIVSVVGAPPVLVAGIRGMNFHRVPELSSAAPGAGPEKFRFDALHRAATFSAASSSGAGSVI